VERFLLRRYYVLFFIEHGTRRVHTCTADTRPRRAMASPRPGLVSAGSQKHRGGSSQASRRAERAAVRWTPPPLAAFESNPSHPTTLRTETGDTPTWSGY